MVVTRQYAGAVIDNLERDAVFEVMRKGWFGLGQSGALFEKGLSSYIGMTGGILTNSGSSANLLALTALQLPKGSEVITTALAFPTTINPIIQNNLVPIFVDCDNTLNINYRKLDEAYSHKTKAVMFAHTLGNPANVVHIKKFCMDNNLFLIEDCCDSLGSTFNGQMLGSFGDLSTYSFYPAHHITMGEGGAVCFKTPLQGKVLRQYRDWGRGCYCRGDEMVNIGACKHRFDFKIMGKNYDHKSIIEKIGYNLKPTELQAAIGVAQMTKLPKFINIRKRNYTRMMNNLKSLNNVLTFPKVYPGADPSWFAFPITITSRKLNRHKLILHLEEKGIQTRLLFAGNITRHPAYKKTKMRIVGDLKNADNVMFNSFMVGIYPGLTLRDIDYISEVLIKYVKSR